MTIKLEDRAIELNIDGVETKVFQVSGKVTYVKGTKVSGQKFLSVSMGSEINPQERRFTWDGDFPIEAENWVTAGLSIVPNQEYPKAVYLAKWHQYGRGEGRVYTRVDYQWDPSKEDMKRIIFE